MTFYERLLITIPAFVSGGAFTFSYGMALLSEFGNSLLYGAMALVFMLIALWPLFKDDEEK